MNRIEKVGLSFMLIFVCLYPSAMGSGHITSIIATATIGIIGTTLFFWGEHDGAKE